MDKKKPKCLPTDTTNHWLTQQMHTIYQIWRLLGIQQCLHQTRRWMESSILNPWGTVRTNGHVFWSHEFPSNLSDDDEYYLLKRGGPGMAISIYGWHCNPYKTETRRIRRPTQSKTQTIYAPRSQYTWTKWSIPQTRKMRVREERDRIPRDDSGPKHPPNGPKEA